MMIISTIDRIYNSNIEINISDKESNLIANTVLHWFCNKSLSQNTFLSILNIDLYNSNKFAYSSDIWLC